MRAPANRAVEIAGFLEQSGWGAAEASPFLADFSPRRYARLIKSDGSTAILMDADADQKTSEFVEIADVLRNVGLSAPGIYAALPEQGFVLMEDLGRQNFGRMLDSGANPKSLYQCAVDVLVHLHKNFLDVHKAALDLPCFGGALFAAQVELFLDVYFPYAQEREATIGERQAFEAAWRQALKGVEALPQSLLLRDYMPDNLMDLPARSGVQSVGLLDFQDAGLGPAVYDVASLCEVVRRDVDHGMLSDMIAYYYQQAKPDLSLSELTSACHVLAAQRHMRVLGILVRLVAKTGQNEKLHYMPRLWDYLRVLMQDEKLKPVREWLYQTGMVHE